jgi:hypothetical protein
MPERTWSSTAISSHAYSLYVTEERRAKEYIQGKQHATRVAKFSW